MSRTEDSNKHTRSTPDLEWLSQAHASLAASTREETTAARTRSCLLRKLGELYSANRSYLIGPWHLGDESSEFHLVGRGMRHDLIILEPHFVEVVGVTLEQGEAQQFSRASHTHLSFGLDATLEVHMGLKLRDGQCYLVGLQYDTSAQLFTPLELNVFAGLASRAIELTHQGNIQERLELSTQIADSVWGNSALGLALVDEEGRCIRSNDALSEILGRPPGEVDALAAKEWLPTGWLETSLGLWRGQLMALQKTPRNVEIKKHHIQVGEKEHTLLITQDRSEIELLHQQIRQLMRHKLIGSLCGGVVHDMNNLLTVVVAALDTAAERPTDSALPELLVDAAEAVSRCEALGRQLMTMGRQRPGMLQRTQPDVAIESVRRLLERTVDVDTNLELNLNASDCTVNLASGALELIVVQLVLNARDAVGKGGTVKVATRRSGDRIHVEVQDSGVGMPEPVLQQMFKPFFSTKTGDDGQGLGLALVHSLVSQVGGQIEVVSAIGGGTRFDLSLQLSEHKVESDLPEASRELDVSGEGKIVLVCENEPVLRNLICRTLSERGYEVVSSPNGSPGLDFLAQGARIDVLVTDMVMPKVDGSTLALACNSNGRSTPVVFVSALVHCEELPELEVPTRFLRKPFRMKDLLGSVESVLQA